MQRMNQAGCSPGTRCPIPQLREGTHLMIGKHINGDRGKSQTQKLAVLFPRPESCRTCCFPARWAWCFPKEILSYAQLWEYPRVDGLHRLWQGIEANTSFSKWETEARGEGSPVQSSAEPGCETRLLEQLRIQASETGGPEFNPDPTVGQWSAPASPRPASLLVK